MPSVLLAADFKPEVTIVDGEGDEEDNEEWNYLPIGKLIFIFSDSL